MRQEVSKRRVRWSRACVALLSGLVTAVTPVAVFGVMPVSGTPAQAVFAPAPNTLFDLPGDASPPKSIAGEITTTLRNALAQADLPADVLQQLTRVVGKTADTSARAYPGDYFRMVYEPVDGSCCGQAFQLTALDVKFRGATYAGVWFVTDERPNGAFYRFDGTLMSGLRFTFPVVATRVSSTFGGRVHPVSRQQHVHSGVDLAAPVGRPVHAAADGLVAHIGNDPRGYGKYVVIKHANGYASYYAHLSKIEHSLRKGMHIARAQRVGAVGKTGTATGPHLHFEVKRNDEPIDPLTLIRKSNAVALRGEQLKAFQRIAGIARLQLAAAGGESLSASSTTPGSIC